MHRTPQEANTAWALAMMNQSDEKLFKALARTAERRENKFKLQDLANTAWAFATVSQSDEKLFTAWARAAKKRVRRFRQQDLATTACAFATVNQSGEKLYTLVARAAERQMPTRARARYSICLGAAVLLTQNLANTAWPLETIQCTEPRQHGMGT